MCSVFLPNRKEAMCLEQSERVRKAEWEYMRTDR